MQSIASAHIKFIEARHEHLVVIVDDAGDVVTIGCLEHDSEAQAWAKEVIDNRSWEDGTEPPDMYSRPLAS